MLDPDALQHLSGAKNLLTFSGGVDSTALFFLLNDAGIAFDIAHVNYHTRQSSSDEAAYAAALAERFAKRCYVSDAPRIDANFEANARKIRYDFFEMIVREHGYANLITAHQLDDRLEWLLMQLCKGAGLPELLGMEPVSPRDGYHLVRPLLSVTKAELKTWLDDRKATYFEDESNRDERFKRNRFRHRFSDPMLREFRNGIENSFRFLETDAALVADGDAGIRLDEVLLLKRVGNRLHLMRNVDRWLKQNGVLMRQGEKERILKEDEVVVSRRYVLSIGRSFALAAPVCDAVMTKTFKEQCRRLGIGPGVRPYLFRHPVIFERLLQHLPGERS